MPGAYLVSGAFLGLVLPPSVDAQAAPRAPEASPIPWSVVDAVGYGGLGFGLGLAAAWDLEGEDFGPPASAVLVVGAGTAAGLIGGAVLGRRGDSAVRGGPPVSRATGAAVLAGGVLAGGTVGALASVPFIEGEGEGTFLGSDERTFVLFGLGGTVLGIAYARRYSGRLLPWTVGLSPVLHPGDAPGLLVRFSYAPECCAPTPARPPSDRRWAESERRGVAGRR